MHPAIKYAEQICYSSKEVLHFTYEMAKKYANTPGIYVECGVAAGAQIIAMAAGAPNKTIYAFDSFQGLPLPSNKDDQMPGIRMLSKEEQSKLPNPGEQELKSTGATSVPMIDMFCHLFYALDKEPKNVFAIPGWFEETVPKWSEENKNTVISILRLDGDLYNSTYVCLKYLYPKVIKGGCVIIDDWALLGCRKAVEDYMNSSEVWAPNWEWGLEYIKDENSTVAYWTK